MQAKQRSKQCSLAFKTATILFKKTGSGHNLTAIAYKFLLGTGRILFYVNRKCDRHPFKEYLINRRYYCDENNLFIFKCHQGT